MADDRSTGPRLRRPGVFKAAVVLLGLSALAYGLVEYTSEGRPASLGLSPETPVVAAMYGAIIIWVAGGSQQARTTMLYSAIVLCIGQLAWAHGTEGLISYLVAVVTSAVAMVFLYVPKSTAYVAARESYFAQRQVRRLFEERGRDGERLHTVSGIAGILGMSRTTVYQHLDPDQQQQLRRS